MCAHFQQLHVSANVLKNIQFAICNTYLQKAGRDTSLLYCIPATPNHIVLCHVTTPAGLGATGVLIQTLPDAYQAPYICFWHRTSFWLHNIGRNKNQHWYSMALWK